MTTEAYNAGYDAQLQGKDLSWNTHKPGSAEYVAWINGYADAQAEEVEDPFTKLLVWVVAIVLLTFAVTTIYFLVV